MARPKWEQEKPGVWVKRWHDGSMARVFSDKWRGKKKTRYSARVSTPHGGFFMDGHSTPEDAQQWADIELAKYMRLQPYS